MSAPEAVPVVAVDGPGGSGKSVLGSRLSRRLGFHLLDSGALYRLTALAAARAGVALDDAAAVGRVAAGLRAEFRVEDDGPPAAWLDGVAVDRELRTEACADAASRVAALPAVRAALLVRQRDFRRAPGLVADGRDMGTVVFPDAALKLFLTARARVRAERRHKQLIAKGISANFQDLLGEMQERDRRDTDRAVAPLRPAADAVVVDTSEQSLDVVFDRVMELVRARGIGLPVPE